MEALERRSEPIGGTLKLLADPTRLRILALLEGEELSVGELSRALGLAQSRVSNHLRPLREAGLLGERHAGPRTFLWLLPMDDGALAGRLWRELRPELAGLAEHAADRVRLEGVLADRTDAGFFDRLAGEWDKAAGSFATGQARERAAVHLLPARIVVADLGSGTGTMAQALLGSARRVICVDASPGMLAEAERRLARLARGTEVEFRRGQLDALPLADAEVDGVVCGMVLHHLPDLDGPLAEMRRVLRPGGAGVVLELAPHGEVWMRERLGDRHLGLEPSDVTTGFARAGFEDVVLDPVADRYLPVRPDGTTAKLDLYIVRGRRARVPMSSANPRTKR